MKYEDTSSTLGADFGFIIGWYVLVLFILPSADLLLFAPWAGLVFSSVPSVVLHFLIGCSPLSVDDWGTKIAERIESSCQRWNWEAELIRGYIKLSYEVRPILFFHHQLVRVAFY